MAKKRESDKPKLSQDEQRKADLLERAKKRYEAVEAHWAEQRKLSLEWIKFRAGEQWPEAIKKERDDDNRPCLVLDKGEQYIRQVVNDGRQNRPSITYVPRGGGDGKVANHLKGFVRALLSASAADQAFDTALDHACGHGFGWFRVLTEYESPHSFNQVIRVSRIRNALAVMIAPHQEADGSDTEDGFVIDTLPQSVFKRKFPNAKYSDLKSQRADFGAGWASEDDCKVVEWFYREPGQEEIVQLADGTVVEAERYDKAVEAGVESREVVGRRTVEVDKIKWAKFTGAEILEEREWAGRFIPIIPVYGTETDIDGKVTYSGMVKCYKDGQMLYNFSRTAFAERVALTPKAPYVAAVGQTEEDPAWATANTKNHNVLTYNPVEINGQALPPPRREQASDIPAGFDREMQRAEHDIEASLGMYAASLGAKSNEKSGRAILARQREGDVATFHYHDNLNRAIRLLGKVILDLIPKVYDTKRVVRLLDEAGESQEAVIAPDLPGGAAIGHVDGLEIFTLGVGEYDVDTISGPSYTTKRQEATEAMTDIAATNPQVWATHGDLIVKAQDWPGADEWVARTYALMPPEMRQAIEKAKQEQDMADPKIRAVIEAADAEIQKREQALGQAQEVIATAQKAVEEAREEAERAKMEAQAIKDAVEVGSKQRILDANTRTARAELELRDERLVAALREIQQQTVEQVKALAMPEPSIVQPEAVAPVGPAPEVLAILDAFNERTEALVAAITAPRRRVPERDPMTGLITSFVEAADQQAQPEGVI